MKKNLKIVSAAAAALLAVAPVAASAVVMADNPNPAADTNTQSGVNQNITINGAQNTEIHGDVMLTSHLTATTTPATTTITTTNGKTTTKYSNWNGKVSGNVTATLNGQTYTMNLPLNNPDISLWQLKTKKNSTAIKDSQGNVDPSNGANYVHADQHSNGQYIIKPGVQYFVMVNHASFNFGTANANRSGLTVASNEGIRFRAEHTATVANPWVRSIKLNTNQNGTQTRYMDVMIPVKATQTNGTTDNTDFSHYVRVWNKKASYIYNENHVRQGNNIMYKIGSGHNVVSENGQPRVYHLANGFDAYRLADGYYKGDYVDVRNFQTTRVHVVTNSNHKRANVRSRVFDVRGKAVKGLYIEKGATVRIYGTKTIKGHKMYKIAKHNRYVKVANF